MNQADRNPHLGPTSVKTILTRQVSRSFSLCGVILLVGIMTLSGCYGKRELEERSFVTMLGVDLGEKHRLLATVMVAIPRALSAGGGGGGAGGGGGGASNSFTLYSAEGDSLFEALDNVEIMNARELSTLHLAFLVIGQDLAENDVGLVMDAFTRSLEFRHNTPIAVCKGRAIDFLRRVNNAEEVEPSLYVTKLVTTSSETLGVCPLITIHDFSVGFSTIGMDPWAPYLSLASPSPTEKPGAGELSSSSKKPQSGSDSSGASQGSQSNPGQVATILGTAVFRTVDGVEKMVGYLDTHESMAALLLAGRLKAGMLQVALPGDQAETAMSLHQAAVSRKISIVDNSVRVEFIVRCTVTINEIQLGIRENETDPQLRQAVVFTTQDQLRELLSRTFEKLAQFQTDVLGVGRSVQTKFWTYPEWVAFDWPSRFKDTIASFDLKVHVLSYGFSVERLNPK